MKSLADGRAVGAPRCCDVVPNDLLDGRILDPYASPNHCKSMISRDIQEVDSRQNQTLTASEYVPQQTLRNARVGSDNPREKGIQVAPPKILQDEGAVRVCVQYVLIQMQRVRCGTGGYVDVPKHLNNMC